ncbi:MAG: hypothetical protein J6M53_05755 [Bacteroidaceae bacterium]|nr:hypothetical protein [Bacteroidaceae bacterium]
MFKKYTRRAGASLLLALAALCAPVQSALAQGTEDWKNYLSYRRADRCEAVGDVVYGVFGGNLLSCDTQTGEVRLFSKTDGLGAKGIVATGYSAAVKRLVLVYDDATVDLLDPATDAIEHIVSLKNAASTVGTPLTMTVTGDRAAIGTQQGVALLNLSRQEVTGFYPLGSAVTAAAYQDGLLYVANEGKLLAGDTGGNLYDRSQWQTLRAATVLLLQPSSGGLYVQMRSSGLLWLTGGLANPVFTTLSPERYTGVHQCGTRTAFFREGEALVFNASAPATVARTLTLDGTPRDVLPMSDSRVWLCRGEEGMQAWRVSAEGALTAEGGAVGGYGAQTDRTGFLHFEGDRLLCSGGSFDYYEIAFYDPNAGYFEDGAWTFLQTEGVSQVSGTPYRSLTSMAQDPADPAHHFVATGDYGLFEFRDTRLVHHYTLDNSPLRDFWGGTKNYVRTDALCYDAAGNLWMSNEQVDTVLRVLRADGTWAGVYVGDIKGCRHVEHIFFDTDGRLWATQRDWIGNYRAGVLCIPNPAGVLAAARPGTDASASATFRYASTNEDGTAVDFSQGVYSIVQDKAGRIWFGAYSGLFVIDNPAAFTQSGFTVTQVKVPRNDGTNYADYLMDGIPCTALAVDGADRKWIGTQGSGLFLVSSDGTEILEHFTADGSPLPSDNVLALAVHPRTGEVFIGTDAGMVSYLSGVTEAADQLTESGVVVYPNPVRPAEGQRVTVGGLTDRADIKITTAAGFAVATGTSTGGSFRWDCRDSGGRLVPAGVYYILVATEDAGAHVAAKVAVVR